MTEQKQGGILLISHLGNFEICRCLSSSQNGFRLTVLLHTRHARKFNQLLEELTARHTVELLEVTKITPATAMLLNERCSRGEFIAIAGDRVAIDFPQNCFMANFLGQPAPFPKGPFTLAAILQVPLISVFCLKEQDGYHIYFDQLSETVVAPRKQREQILQQLAQRYANQLQKYCLREPLQWYNFFHFWALPAQHDPLAENPGGPDKTSTQARNNENRR